MSWLDSLTALLGAGHYYRRAICLANDPVIIGLYVVSDLAIWAAYTVIGASLVVLYTGTMRLTRTATILFGSFILICGLSHLIKSLTLFVGVYYLDLTAMLCSAVVSALTAILTAREAVNAWRTN